MDLDLLLAVQQQRPVVGEAGHVGESTHATACALLGTPRASGHPARRDDGEAGQHLEILLERIRELAGVGRAEARADPEVVEDHVVGSVAARGLAEICAECLLTVDRHVVLLESRGSLGARR